MIRLPLDVVTPDPEPDEPAELPCECCGTPTTYRLSTTLDDLTPCCLRDACTAWVASGINFNHLPDVGWDEL